MMMSGSPSGDADFESSKLGTKEHWDFIYEKEINNYEEFGDEGEVWFGKDSVEEMVDWCLDNIPPSAKPNCLDVGTGNGSLLFALAQSGYNPVYLHGIDYSEPSIALARSIGRSRGQGCENITFTHVDFLHQIVPDPSNPSDSGQKTQQEGTYLWDLLLDKGTYDAIALAPVLPNGEKLIEAYRGRVEAALRPGGFFMITSCNFTEDELKDNFTKLSFTLVYHSKVKRPTFSFGGKSGTKIATLIFQKTVPSSSVLTLPHVIREK